MKTYIKSFRDYILENSQLVKSGEESLKIQILLRGCIGLTGKSEDFTKELMHKIYKDYIHLVLIKGVSGYNRNEKIPEDRRFNMFNDDLPVLNFTSRYHQFLDKSPRIYNRLEHYPIATDKKIFHKSFNDCKYVPKAVFSIRDIEKLTLPIIAKPKDGFSAQGIEVFETYDDAKKSDLEFDIWSEKKEIDTEFRVFIMNGKIIHLTERITNTSNDMSVGVKNPDEKIDLVYIDQDMTKFPYMNTIKDIHNKISEKVELDFYNIDLMLDKSGDIWVPEINGAPGIGPSMVHHIYKNWLEMAYNMKMDKGTENDLIGITNEHRRLMKKKYPKEYNSSVAPI